MIHQLLTYFVEELLIPGFGSYGQFIAIQVGTPEETTSIGLLAGPLQVSQQVKDVRPNEPQPQPIREAFVFTDDSYTLAKFPIKGSLIAAFVLDQNGKKELLDEGDDFSVDYNAKILTLIETYDGDAAQLILQYTFIGVVTLREFEQEFIVGIQAASYDEVEEIASLVTTILLTHQQEALEAVNPTNYDLEAYQSVHLLLRYQWLSGELVSLASNKYQYQLRFQVQGQLKSVKTTPDLEYGVIKSVLSPGVEADDDLPVNVEVELG